ncbi:MAG: sensor histidine kinase KdpD [FCB group bacterium]
MDNNYEIRPDPDSILASIKNEEAKSIQGKLKIFLGMSAGVGKTYTMLEVAHEAKKEGKDIIIGYVETHNRQETEKLTKGLELIPRKSIEYKGISVEEMDIDSVLQRKPAIVLVDELAHTNAPGSRHIKRYQDVIELLENGINVFTTLNVQHIESRTDIVAEITGIKIHETVPDSVVDLADDIEIIDLPPEDLLKRLAEGKVYIPEKAKQASENFFRIGNLTALREIALRLTAERVDKKLQEYMQKKNIIGPWKSGERLLVAISPSPYSANLIRWTRRLASTMNASWLAVYVQTSQPLSDRDNEELFKNINLVQELGGEIIRTTDEDIVKGLLRIALQKNVSQIIIGKTLRNTIFSFFKRKDLVTRLLSESGDIDIYAVRAEKFKQQTKKKRFIPQIKSGIKQYVIAILIITMVATLCFPLTPYIGYQTVGLILLFTITLLPLIVGRGPILVAAITSSLLWNYFFIPPIFTFHIEKIQDIITLSVNFSVALVTGFLTAKIRYQQRAVKQREERAVALYNLTNELSHATSKESVAKKAVDNIVNTFDADAVFLVPNANKKIEILYTSLKLNYIDYKQLSVATWSFENNKIAGVNTDNLPDAEFQFFPITTPRDKFAVLGLKYKSQSAPLIDQETLLLNFITQISSAYERELSEEKAKQLLLMSESEKLYQTLLNSISHELRTPISIITGATSTMIDSDINLEPNAIKELTLEIQLAANRLNRLVENLLDMTRLESGLMKLNLDWCDINDLISVVLKQLQKELTNHQIIIEAAPDLPLIKLDFVLMSQALINILQNSAVYTQEGSIIKIKLLQKGKDIIICIEDNGPGFPENALPHIFDKFYRSPGTKAGGTGLGLSISKGFIEAHGGKIEAENVKTGGARFNIILNTSESPDMTQT